MRELKFRAWDGKRMIEDVIPASEASIVEFFEYEWQETEVEAIEQYTGLKDKNGKEIFEGDIVEFGLSGRPERGYVAYADEYASFEVYSKRDFIFGGLFGKAGEVIGNIHENGDLLEEK